MRRPVLPIFTRDVLGDPQLRACHPQSIGLWWLMLCVMQEGEPYGHLRMEPVNVKPPKLTKRRRRAPPGGTPNGVADARDTVGPNAGPLAIAYALLENVRRPPRDGSLESILPRLTGMDAETIAWCVWDLEVHRVLNRTSTGVIYCEWMVDQWQRHQQRADRARKAYQGKDQPPPQPQKTSPSAPTRRSRTKSESRPPAQPPASASARPRATPDGVPSARANARPRATADGVPLNRTSLKKDPPPQSPPASARGGRRRTTRKQRQDAEAREALAKSKGGRK